MDESSEKSPPVIIEAMNSEGFLLLEAKDYRGAIAMLQRVTQVARLEARREKDRENDSQLRLAAWLARSPAPILVMRPSPDANRQTSLNTAVVLSEGPAAGARGRINVEGPPCCAGEKSGDGPAAVRVVEGCGRSSR